MPIIVTKTVKPKLLDVKGMRFEFLKGMTVVARKAQAEYRKFVKDWKPKHRPKFTSIKQVVPELTLVVGPTGSDEALQIFEWLNSGTKRHFVGPKKKQALHWGKPGTGPKGKGFFSKGHYVKGIKARKYDAQVKKIIGPEFKREMERAMKAAKAKRK